MSQSQSKGAPAISSPSEEEVPIASTSSSSAFDSASASASSPSSEPSGEPHPPIGPIRPLEETAGSDRVDEVRGGADCKDLQGSVREGSQQEEEEEEGESHNKKGKLRYASASIEGGNDSVEERGVATQRRQEQASVEETQEQQHGQAAATTRASSSSTSTGQLRSEGHGWQSVWSPQHNAYYFWNSQTNSTTWTNPLQGPAQTTSLDASSRVNEGVSQSSQWQQGPMSQEELALAVGIDPALAHLDPALYASQLRAAVTGSQSVGVDREGASRFSQANRARRQMANYFDVEEWERQKEKEHTAGQEQDTGASGKRHRHPSKKEVQEFKDKKRERKKAKLGWLHS